MTANQSASQPRFHAREAWSKLTDEQRDEIGAYALEHVICLNGEDAHADQFDEASARARRPFMAARPIIDDLLMDAACAALRDAVPALHDDTLPVPVPSTLGQLCRVCACSEFDACHPPCGWAEQDLCSSCAAKAEA